jgi:hypothetical protein
MEEFVPQGHTVNKAYGVCMKVCSKINLKSEIQGIGFYDIKKHLLTLSHLCVNFWLKT